MKTETIDDVLALIQTTPGDVELYQRLGTLYSHASQPDEARQAFERSLEFDDKDPFTHLFLGNSFYACRMYSEALAQFQRAAELLPNKAVAYWCQGDAYRAQGRYNLAHEAYATAVRVDPDDQKARSTLLSWNDWRNGNTDPTQEAILLAASNDQAATTVILAKRWLEAHPDNLWVTHNYAEKLYQMTRYDEAIRVYLEAIDNFPDNRWGLYNQLGHLYRYRGDFALSELWYQKAIDEDPDDAGSYIFLGAVQARQGKLNHAEKSHRAATQCSAGCIDETHHNLGLVLRAQDRLAEAAECFRKAIELCPGYLEAIEALQDVESALALSSN